jgi:HK97 family phage major capsid protein
VPAASGSAYALVQTPPVLPGILQNLFQPLTISALIPEGTIDGPLLRYLVEVAVTNAAATVAELGLKPESAITFAKVDEAVKKIATFLPVSEEMLEDVAYIQSTSTPGCGCSFSFRRRRSCCAVTAPATTWSGC